MSQVYINVYSCSKSLIMSNGIKEFCFSDISAVRFQRLHCTACDAHIGSAPVDSSNMFEHPVLHTLLCSTCREFYGDGTFEQGT